MERLETLNELRIAAEQADEAYNHGVLNGATEAQLHDLANAAEAAYASYCEALYGTQ